MARHPDYSGMGHIDPGDPPMASHNHEFTEPCNRSCPRWNPTPNRYPDVDMDVLMDPKDRPRINTDPIQHSWHPGSVDEQRAHFRPMPVREGPDYASEDFGELPTLSIHVNIPTRERTMRIMRGPATSALLEFLRMQQAYQDTDEALGAQGQFAEIFHDTAKLKRMIWDRRNPQSVAVGEVQETLMSLIGHALLAMDLMEQGNKDGQA